MHVLSADLMVKPTAHSLHLATPPSFEHFKQLEGHGIQLPSLLSTYLDLHFVHDVFLVSDFQVHSSQVELHASHFLVS